MNQQQNKIPRSSVIKWKTGSPVKYTKCLVLCKHNGKYVIHDDVWFGNIRGWQSCWHEMIAWCAYEDITHEDTRKQIPTAPRYRPLRYPLTDKWYKSSVRDNTYNDVMTTARAGREVYCVITDAYGNTVWTLKNGVKVVLKPTDFKADEVIMGVEEQETGEHDKTEEIGKPKNGHKH